MNDMLYKNKVIECLVSPKLGYRLDLLIEDKLPGLAE